MKRFHRLCYTLIGRGRIGVCFDLAFRTTAYAFPPNSPFHVLFVSFMKSIAA